MNAPVIVITGASGFIGSAAAGFFMHCGYSVISAGRKPHRNGYTHLHFDLEDETAAPLQLPTDTTIVLHAAFVTAQQNNRAYELNVNGTRKLLEAAKQAGVHQFIFLSSLSALPDAVSIYGRQKFACEKLVLENGGTVVRPGLVIGNGGLFASMQKHIAAGKRIPIFNGGNQPLQTVYVSNLLIALHRIIILDVKGIVTIATPEAITYKHFFELVATDANTHAKFINLPLAPVKLLLRMARMLGIKLPVSDDNLAGLQSMRKVESAGDLAKLGMVLKNAEESIRLLK
ncbi:MAG: NAD(P)-dependent oxidoreductase [Bacteroidia bacterium]|jgi:NADH dehydrogenase|nr:NAD(P)-dependent oxidoreductase [Bacteroidia bacterium]